MSRSIAVVGDSDHHRRVADELGRLLGRRVVDGPTSHDDEVALVDPAHAAEIDTALACVVAPTVDDVEKIDQILQWAMDRGDVLTRGEHEQVMP